jgi:hypothetical protein
VVVVLPLAGHGMTGCAAVARRKQLIDHGDDRPPGLCHRRRDVHAQTWRCVTPHHATVLVFQRLEHAFTDHVHAAMCKLTIWRHHRTGGQRRVHVRRWRCRRCSGVVAQHTATWLGWILG